jgi:pimeloyl-ACP methyl ester carboxylesterase
MSAMEQAPKMRGELIHLGPSRRMRLVRAGPPRSHRPTVLLEAGSFGFSADWAAVQEKLAAAGLRSLAYDRAGLGRSDPGPAPRDSQAVVADLEHLLEAAAEAGPFILCGHSMAGLHVRLFAGRNRARVKGVVLVDAATPEGMDEPLVRQMVGHFGTLSKLAAWGASAGVQRPLSGALGDAIGLPQPAKSEKHWAFADAGHNRWAAAEAQTWAASAEQARNIGPYDPSWPVAVVLTGSPGQEGPRIDMLTAPVKDSRDGFVVYAPGANHASMIGARHGGRVVEAILKVERAAEKAC